MFMPDRTRRTKTANQSIEPTRNTRVAFLSSFGLHGLCEQAIICDEACSATAHAERWVNIFTNNWDGQ